MIFHFMSTKGEHIMSNTMGR